MKRAHIWVGALALIAFFGTGLAMTLQSPPLVNRDDFTRMLFRSRHIYLLSAALLNLLLGAHLQLQGGAFGRVQAVGSSLLLVSPLLALAGFYTDPAVGTLDGGALGKYAVFAMFGGTLVHVLSTLPWSRPRA